MTETEKRTAESFTSLLSRLSEQDRDYLMAYGEGMACKAARMTCDSAPEQQPQK